MSKIIHTPHSLPSQAILTGNGHYILLVVRAGYADASYARDPEILGPVAEIEKMAEKLPKEYDSPCEFLMLRGIWFDDKHGGYKIYVDLIHDRQKKPSMSAEEIKEALHHGYAWPEGQTVIVAVRVIPEFIYGDGFFPNSDEFYVGMEFWEDAYRKPGDRFYVGHGEWE